MKEADIQKSIAEALDMAQVTWFHCPNENKLLSQADNPGHLMGVMKNEGLKPGVPDCLILDAPPNYEDHYCGAALEIKAGNNKPTDNQKRWLKKLGMSGFRTDWAQGFNPCYSVLQDWGYV